MVGFAEKFNIVKDGEAVDPLDAKRVYGAQDGAIGDGDMDANVFSVKVYDLIVRFHGSMDDDSSLGKIHRATFRQMHPAAACGVIDDFNGGIRMDAMRLGFFYGMAHVYPDCNRKLPRLAHHCHGPRLARLY